MWTELYLFLAPPEQFKWLSLVPLSYFLAFLCFCVLLDLNQGFPIFGISYFLVSQPVLEYRAKKLEYSLILKHHHYQKQSFPHAKPLSSPRKSCPSISIEWSSPPILEVKIIARISLSLLLAPSQLRSWKVIGKTKLQSQQQQFGDHLVRLDTHQICANHHFYHRLWACNQVPEFLSANRWW